MQHARAGSFHQTHVVAHHPQTGHAVAADLSGAAVREYVDHVVGSVVVRLRGFQQRFRYRHRHRSADQRNLRHARGVPRCSFQCHQRAHAVADQRRLTEPRGIQHANDPVCQRADGIERMTCRLAVPGQVDRQRVPAVVGEIAALQRPDAVVVRCAVDEYDGGLCAVDALACGVDERARVVDNEIHFISFANGQLEIRGKLVCRCAQAFWDA